MASRCSGFAFRVQRGGLGGLAQFGHQRPEGPGPGDEDGPAAIEGARRVHDVQEGGGLGVLGGHGDGDDLGRGPGRSRWRRCAVRRPGSRGSARRYCAPAGFRGPCSITSLSAPPPSSSPRSLVLGQMPSCIPGTSTRSHSRPAAAAVVSTCTEAALPAAVGQGVHGQFLAQHVLNELGDGGAGQLVHEAFGGLEDRQHRVEVVVGAGTQDAAGQRGLRSTSRPCRWRPTATTARFRHSRCRRPARCAAPGTSGPGAGPRRPRGPWFREVRAGQASR